MNEYVIKNKVMFLHPLLSLLHKSRTDIFLGSWRQIIFLVLYEKVSEMFCTIYCLFLDTTNLTLVLKN